MTDFTSLRTGASRTFTFRLPKHVPTAWIVVNVRRGCVSLFASNCSRKPQAAALYGQQLLSVPKSPARRRRWSRMLLLVVAVSPLVAVLRVEAFCDHTRLDHKS